MAWDIHNLFKRHAQELKRSLRRRGLSEDNAADLTQDTFLRIMTVSARGSVDNPRAYLFQVSRNLATDFERRSRAAPFLAIAEDIVEAVADPRPSAEKALYDKQRLLASQTALAELPRADAEGLRASPARWPVDCRNRTTDRSVHHADMVSDPRCLPACARPLERNLKGSSEFESGCCVTLFRVALPPHAMPRDDDDRTRNRPGQIVRRSR